jgi:ABC-type antimicrobial peptide transport system permease subunit
MNHLKIVRGGIPGPGADKNAMMSEDLATFLQLKVGDPFSLKYASQFEKNKEIVNTYTVAALYTSNEASVKNVVLLQEDSFYKTFLENLPVPPSDGSAGFYVPKKGDSLYPVFSPEWKLLPQTKTGDEWLKKIHTMNKTRWKGPALDVSTMYERASDILKMESALNVITFISVLILFFIILIGVINTLRMTIHERTREIGTMRAIGMQRNDVRDCFIMETVLLSFFSCIAGTAAAIIIMQVTGMITIDTTSFFSIFLVDKHLYFLPTVKSILGNVVFILIITAVTAYFPAKRAARLSAAEALRHFE